MDHCKHLAIHPWRNSALQRVPTWNHRALAPKHREERNSSVRSSTPLFARARKSETVTTCLIGTEPEHS